MNESPCLLVVHLGREQYTEFACIAATATTTSTTTHFKIRTEERRWAKIKQELEEQSAIFAKLKVAHATVQSEKADVKAMQDHDLRGEEGDEPAHVIFDNPLQE